MDTKKITDIEDIEKIKIILGNKYTISQNFGKVAIDLYNENTTDFNKLMNILSYGIMIGKSLERARNKF